MRELRPPQVPDTPRFLAETEDMLRTATRHRRRLPRLPRFALRWSAAPLGTGAVGLLAVAFVLNVASMEPASTSSIPHWTAATVEETPVEAPDPVRRPVIFATSEGHQALIDGKFRIDELRPDRGLVLPPPSTIPQ